MCEYIKGGQQYLNAINVLYSNEGHKRGNIAITIFPCV